MALNPGQSGDSHNWNYTKPDNPGFTLKLVGTVFNIQEVQAMNFGADGRPTTPKFWENSNQPMMNIRMILIGPKGGYRTWTFTPASKAAREGKKPSVHLDLFRLAGGKNMLDLVGKTLEIETDAPPAGFSYGIGNPRPWRVKLSDQGPFTLTEEMDPVFTLNQVFANTAVSGGAPNPGPGVATAAAMQAGAEQAAGTPADPAPVPPDDNEEIPF